MNGPLAKRKVFLTLGEVERRGGRAGAGGNSAHQWQGNQVRNGAAVKGSVIARLGASIKYVHMGDCTVLYSVREVQ